MFSNSDGHNCSYLLQCFLCARPWSCKWKSSLALSCLSFTHQWNSDRRIKCSTRRLTTHRGFSASKSPTQASVPSHSLVILAELPLHSPFPASVLCLGVTGSETPLQDSPFHSFFLWVGYIPYELQLDRCMAPCFSRSDSAQERLSK